MLQRLAQRGLVALADRLNLFVVSGMRSRGRINYRAFIQGTYWWTSLDYVRNATTELLSLDLCDLEVGGAVAEVGVYQGNNAALLNQYFPDRKLFLFDTFEGFDVRDSSIDKDHGWSNLPQDFSSTSLGLVLTKLPHPDNAVIRKGWFPESAGQDEDETFCFVSIDVDLYQPTMAALQWFYPRVNEGGHLLVHDYNNDDYKGVKHAVRKFCTDNGIRWSLLPDRCGTAVITKGTATPAS
jgi:O-methyltransferase